MLRENSLFVCMDDKHCLKVGEPNYPVAAVERGRRVFVSRNQTFEVADHDFTRVSLIPSVSFVVDIPDDVADSWSGLSNLVQRRVPLNLHLHSDMLLRSIQLWRTRIM